MANSTKDLRKKFGLALAAIQVTKLFRKSITFDHKETADNPGTGAWYFITPDGRLGQANTYSGGLGRNYSLQTSPMPDEKSLAKRLKTYTEVTDMSTPGADCFQLVPSPKPEAKPETPANPTPDTVTGAAAADEVKSEEPEPPAPAEAPKSKKGKKEMQPA